MLYAILCYIRPRYIGTLWAWDHCVPGVYHISPCIYINNQIFIRRIQMLLALSLPHEIRCITVTTELAGHNRRGILISNKMISLVLNPTYWKSRPKNISRSVFHTMPFHWPFWKRSLKCSAWKVLINWGCDLGPERRLIYTCLGKMGHRWFR